MYANWWANFLTVTGWLLRISEYEKQEQFKEVLELFIIPSFGFSLKYSYKNECLNESKYNFELVYDVTCVENKDSSWQTYYGYDGLNYYSQYEYDGGNEIGEWYVRQWIWFCLLYVYQEFLTNSKDLKSCI